ncbi:MAG TPA: thiolase family protein [Acidimicrobiales bacterium]|jgi:acetyl-CoA C-acetyltransferase|nr:thiolase family protein [Acidimicrobiales bacterium]
MTEANDAVIVAAVRTPIGRSGRSLAGLSLQDIGMQTVAGAIAAAGLAAEDIDDLLLGEVLQGGGCTARYVANALGLPPDTPGGATQRQCATGMMAVQEAAANIRSGMADAVIAGGVESMTRSPLLFEKSPFPFGGVERFIPPSHPNTPDAPNMNMLITVGENTARECGITREESDDWSYHSNIRAVNATDMGYFDAEIIPVTVPAGRGETVSVSVDEHPRRDTTLEKLAALRSLTGPDGQITAGNSSGIADGGAAVVVVSRAYAEAHGMEPLATVRSWNSCGIEPARTGLAPTICVPRALNRAGLSESDVDLVEINEAFATMAVACSRKLGFPHEIVNVNGGAVGIGHPVGASGARILVTLVHELRRRGGGIGVGTLCAGGGMGSATVLEVHAPA